MAARMFGAATERELPQSTGVATRFFASWAMRVPQCGSATVKKECFKQTASKGTTYCLFQRPEVRHRHTVPIW